MPSLENRRICNTANLSRVKIILEKEATTTGHTVQAMVAREDMAMVVRERVLPRITEATAKETSTTHRTTAPTKGMETTNIKTNDKRTMLKTRETMMATKQGTSTKEVTRLRTSPKMEFGTKSTTRPGNLNLAESLREKYQKSRMNPPL